jgi:hypothetical protein
MQTGKISGISQKAVWKLKRLSIANLPRPPFTSLGTLKSHFGASGEVLQRLDRRVYRDKN